MAVSVGPLWVHSEAFETAKAFLACTSSGAAQVTYLTGNPAAGVAAAASDADTSGYTEPQKKSAEIIADSGKIAQIPDRDRQPALTALTALATHPVTWSHNDFLWGLSLMLTGSRFPVTSAPNDLEGQFFVNDDLIVAGAILVAIPTLIVFLALQKHFISGLTLGSTQG